MLEIYIIYGLSLIRPWQNLPYQRPGRDMAYLLPKIYMGIIRLTSNPEDYPKLMNTPP
jgi:hypothetical protein